MNQALQLVCLASFASSLALRNPLVSLQAVNELDYVFQLGNSSFLATSASPSLEVPVNYKPVTVAATHIVATSPLITGQYLQDTFYRYLADDDVFTEDFFETIIISSNYSSELDFTARNFVESIGSQILFLPAPANSASSVPPPGPMLLESDGKTIKLSKVFRLYTDTYSSFVHGVYESDGAYRILNLVDQVWGYPLVPVPSRLYSQVDSRPLAGKRVGVKDIYDVKGLKTTLGSKAWTRMTSEANATASSIQRIIDLGGVVVGKQKTSQFASAAHAWEWTDVYYPQNPRGDGYLSCSASSSGGGCSIAAYAWLDFAIGSDTGQSMRQPAAFAGVYGNRPSQGLMDLTGAMPISYGTDTAGVFARNPVDWVEFAKVWYDPALRQSSDLNELPSLDVSDVHTFPRRILYPTDHLPLRNPAAEATLQTFLDQVMKTMNLTIEKINVTQKVEAVTGRVYDDILADLGILWTYTQLKVVATPLLDYYSPDFPALDRSFRSSWENFTLNTEEHVEALQRRQQDSEAWHREVLFSTEGSCSESVLIYDIGTGGLPSFREDYLNESPGAALPDETGTRGAGSVLASYFGSADFTIPIGQVPYYSNVTHQEVSMPVTINMVVKRGCDFVLFNFIQELAKHGLLAPVSIGLKAFP
ncbi:amidase 1 [Colletotrichum liriopes]|uniref:Amidase 1 n=1 Tax=Colletotrichum liriopes TaxID=708192 RepID=A0AA37LZ03_9PEZI|nr:amidase 1 [Colletotrichum liriopes]